MLKIAFCIRGELRTWEYCKRNIIAQILTLKNEHQCTVFLDSWSNQPNQISQDEIINDFTEAGIKCGRISFHVKDRSEKSHLSFLRLNYLSLINRKEFELAQGEDFDVVVLLRPDILIFGNFSFHIPRNLLFWGVNCFFDQEKTNNSVYFDSTEHFDFTEIKTYRGKMASQTISHFSDDILVLGFAPVIDLYQEAYLDAINEGHDVCAHHTVGSFLRRLNVKIGKMMYTEILRPEAVETEEFVGFLQAYQNDPLAKQNETKGLLDKLSIKMAELNKNRLL